MKTFKEFADMLSEAQDLKAQIRVLLDKVEDDAELEMVKNSLMKKYLKAKMNVFHRFSWYEGPAKELVKRAIFNSTADADSKFAFVEGLLDDKMKFKSSVFKRPGYKSLHDLVPAKLRNNKVYKEIVPDIMRFSQQAASGVGKGELFLLMFGLNTDKPSSKGAGAKGDVILDGWSVEVKDSGGMIHAGKEDGLAKASSVFQFNRELVKTAEKEGFKTSWKNSKGKTVKADPEQFRFYPSGQSATEGGDWFWRFVTNDIPGGTNDYNPTRAKQDVVDYMQQVYIGMNRKDATKIGNAVFKAIGNKQKFEAVIEKYIQSWVFDAYKKAEKFDSLVVLDMNNGMFVNIVDGDNIPNQVNFKAPQISKGKSTYAVPAGAMKISIK